MVSLPGSHSEAVGLLSDIVHLDVQSLRHVPELQLELFGQAHGKPTEWSPLVGGRQVLHSEAWQSKDVTEGPLLNLSAHVLCHQWLTPHGKK